MEKFSAFRRRRRLVVTFLITFFMFLLTVLQIGPYINVIQSDTHSSKIQQNANIRRPIARNRHHQSPLPTSIMCLVLTTHNTLLSKAKAVNDTWGKRCNKTIFFTNRPTTLPNVVYLDLAQDGRTHLTDKVVRAFEYVHKHFTDYDWFLKADDDTYVILENLRHFLSYFKSNDPVYLGQNYKLYTKQGYNSGGAGYVLSKEALNKLMFGIKYKNCARDGNDEDVDIGKCLDSQDVPVYDTTDKFNRETFHGGTMEDHMVGPLSDLLKNYPSTPARTALHDKAPKYLEELIVLYAPIRTLQSENEGLITKPRDVALNLTMKDDSTELELNCGMTYQFINGKNNRFFVLKKGLKTHIFRLAYCDV